MSKRIREAMGLRKERGVQSAFILKKPTLQNLEHNLTSPILRLLKQARFYVF